MSTPPTNRAYASPQQVARRIAERVGEEPRQLAVKMVARRDVRRFIADVQKAQARSKEKVMAVD
jgi:hypothetical protein